MVDDIALVHAPLVTDRYGNLVRDWANAGTTTHKAWVTQRDASEDDTNRTAEVSGWRMFAYPDNPVAAGDRIIYDGAVFEVVGHPAKAKTPRGPHHVEAELRLVVG